MMTQTRIGSRRGPYLNDGERSSVPDGPSAAGCFRSLTRLSPKAAVLLAIAFGLCGGYLDLSLILVRKTFWRETLSLHNGRDFAWTIPLSLAILMLIPAFLIATLNWLRPRLISVRGASWLFATLTIWAALLRLPLYGACSLLLAAGLGRTVGNAVAARLGYWRTVRFTLTGVLGLLAVLAARTSGRLAIREHLAVAGLSPASPEARNVVLIVWDTVRAYNLSTYGYARNTSPNLTRLASEGVRYHSATAPAPWT